MKGVLISFFDSNNLGDLLISKTMYDLLEERGIEVVCLDFCTSKEIDKEHLTLHSDMNRENRNSDSNRSVIKTKYLIPLKAFIRRIRKKRWMELDSVIASKDFVIIGGGNMVMDYDIFPNYSYVFSKYIQIAKKYQKQVFVLGIGAGPFQFNYQRNLAVNAVRLVDYASTRDALSAHLLKIEHISRDPAFMLKRLPENRSRNKICVSIIDANSRFICANPERYIKSVTNIIQELTECGEVVLFSTEAGDYEMVSKVYERLPAGTVEMKYIYSIESLLELYSQAKLVIGSRMHSLIIAMTQEIPTIAISWSSKVEELYKMASMPERVYRIDEAFSQGVIKSAKELLSTKDEKTRSYIRICKKIIEDEYDRVKSMMMR